MCFRRFWLVVTDAVKGPLLVAQGNILGLRMVKACHLSVSVYE